MTRSAVQSHVMNYAHAGHLQWPILHHKWQSETRISQRSVCDVQGETKRGPVDREFNIAPFCDVRAMMIEDV